MKVASVGELKNNLSKILSLAEHGEIVQIQKRNIPIARLVPYRKFKEKKNKTILGCGHGTVQVKGDLTEPMIPENNWNMPKE